MRFTHEFGRFFVKKNMIMEGRLDGVRAREILKMCAASSAVGEIEIGHSCEVQSSRD